MAPVVAWLATAIGSYVVAEAIVGAVISFAISTAVGYFTKKPSSGAAGFDSSLNLTLSEPDSDRWFIYGETQYGGRLCFARVSDDSQFLHMIVVYACHEIESFQQLLVDDQVLTIDGSGAATDDYAGYLWVKTHLGAWDQTADADLMAAFPSEWTSAHRLRGLAYAYWKFKWNPDLFRDRPNTAARMRGRKVYDQRDEDHDIADPSTWAWSRNALLCAQDYLRGIPMKKSDGALVRWFGVNAEDSEIAFSDMAAEATICDEAVALKAGGTQPRYTLDGIVSTDSEPGDVLTSMLTACAGQRVDAGGQLSLLAGAARTPEIFLDIGDVVGPIRSQPRRSIEQLFNGVKGKYRGEETQYDIADAPPFQDSALVAEDGRENWTDYTMEFTDNAEACQRLQKIYIAANRRQAHAEAPMTLSALRLRAGTWFGFSWPGRGWDGKTFYCDKLTGQHIQDEDGQFYLGINVSMQEIDSHVYDWDKDDATIVEPAPLSNLQRPQAAEPLAIAGEVLEFRDRSKVQFTATPNSGGIATGYQFAYRFAGALDWTQLPDQATPAATTYLDIGTYDIRVRTILQPYGLPSDWVSDSFTVGKPVMTPRPTGLELVGGGASGVFTGPDAQFQWREGSVNAPGFDNDLGADVFQRDPWFAGYRVEMRATDSSLLRMETRFDPSYVYLLDNNRRDSARNLGLGPQRRFSLTLQQIGRQGQEVEYSTPQVIEVANPAPKVPSAIDITTFSRIATLDFTPDDGDGDLAGTIIRGSASSGFDAASGGGDILYQGNQTNHIQIPVTPGETVYVQIANYDAFGTDSLNWSSEIEVTSSGLTAGDFDDALQDAFAQAEALPGNYVLKLDTNGRITGFALIETGGVAAETIAGFLVDKFLIAHPDVNGGDPVPVFVVEGGVIRMNEVFVEVLTATTFKAVWATVDELIAGRIRGASGLMVTDYDDEYIQMDFPS